MRIQGNPGLFTQNHYNHTNTELNKTLNKLSSGYQINQASDDAAGLAISEKMRGQIRGLEQAGENIQDGLSLINTTEGAIGQIQNPNLVRIRELVIQAANDTNTPEDRQLIQLEIDALKRGIDDIAYNTEFNTIKTLIPEDLKIVNSSTAPKLDIVLLIDDSGSMSSSINMAMMGLSTFADKMKTIGDVKIGTASVVYDSNRDLNLTSDIDAVKDHLKNVHKADGGGTKTDETILNILDGSKSLGLRPDSQKVYILLTDTNSEKEGNDVSKHNSEIKNKLDAQKGQLYVLGINHNNSWGNDYDDFSRFYGDYATNIIVPKSVSDISEGLTPGLTDEIIQNAKVEHIIQKDLIIQAGANEGQNLIIPLYDNRGVAIGINNIDVTQSYETTMEGLRRVDIANNILSERRATYGALSNRLEHAYNNVKNTEENLTKAESQLRDTNMAKEMSKLQKDQVLLQSSQSMIAQINQMSQGILQLLK